jgi:diaminopimelate epimerase
MVFGTHGGARTCRVLSRDGATWWIEGGMGVPRVMRRAIGIDHVKGVIDGALVNVGNPHFVTFVDTDDFSSHGMTWQELGAIISVDPMFRFGTNVEFVRVLSANEIEFRIYERGVGPTHSSGTGTCASSAAAIVVHGVERDLGATSIGGRQRVVWPANDQEMLLTGPAEVICRGEVELG